MIMMGKKKEYKKIYLISSPNDALHHRGSCGDRHDSRSEFKFVVD